jgi:hypothetical protein
MGLPPDSIARRLELRAKQYRETAKNREAGSQRVGLKPPSAAQFNSIILETKQLPTGTVKWYSDESSWGRPDLLKRPQQLVLLRHIHLVVLHRVAVLMDRCDSSIGENANHAGDGHAHHQ